MQDWVSYADQVSVVTVLSEAQVTDPYLEESPEGAGLLGRKLRVRVERTIWTAPGFGERTGELTISGGAWTVKQWKPRPVVTDVHATWPEVGATYLVALMRWSTPVSPPEGWQGLTYEPETFDVVGGTAMVRVVEGRVVLHELPSWRADRTRLPVHAQIEGRSVDAVAEMLGATEPDPLAVKYRHLAPLERWLYVSSERERARTEEGDVVPGG